MANTNGERLNKYIALHAGLSRRVADELIASNDVLINDKPAILGARVAPHDIVTVNGQPLQSISQKTYLLFHKPVGYVCSRRQQGDTPTIYSLLPKKYHALKPVGRLDKDSSGLILLTNDGDFAHRMTHPSFHKTKIYEVQLDKPLEPLHQQMISDFGVMLPDGKSKFLVTKKGDQPLATSDAKTSAARFSRDAIALAETQHEAVLTDDDSEKATTYQITMSEGRNRQIRRTFGALGYNITHLHRTNFGNYTLGDINSGKFIKADISSSV